MVADAAANGRPQPIAHVMRQMLAGAWTAVVALPICLAAGLLAFAPLGGDWLGRGAMAAVLAAIFSGLAATLFSRPSAAVTSPRASICLVQASLAVTLMSRPQYENVTVFIDRADICIMQRPPCTLLSGSVPLADQTLRSAGVLRRVACRARW
jgi:SulP family sulfate permease